MNLLIYRIKTLEKYKDLIRELVGRDLKLKYRRSFLGYVWSVLNPLLIMIVLTIVFSTMFNKNIKNYPVYLLSGRVLYDFIKASTTAGMKSVVGNSALLKKVYVPKYIFTLAKVTSCLVDTVLSFGALFIVMIFTGAKFYWTLFLIPFVVLEIYIFSVGLSFFLAQTNVFFRDVEHIYQAVLTAWLYLTPILYPMEKITNPLLRNFIIWCNPLYHYVLHFRCLVYEGVLPDLNEMFIGYGIAFGMLLIGAYFFQRNKDRFILYI